MNKKLQSYKLMAQQSIWKYKNFTANSLFKLVKIHILKLMSHKQLYNYCNQPAQCQVHNGLVISSSSVSFTVNIWNCKPLTRLHITYCAVALAPQYLHTPRMTLSSLFGSGSLNSHSLHPSPSIVPADRGDISHSHNHGCVSS